MSKSILKIFIKFFISFLLLALLWQKVNPEELANSAAMFSTKTTLFCVILYFLSSLISVYKWQVLLPGFSFRSLWSVSMVAQFYSTVLPGQIAGEVVKGYRLGKGRQDAERVVASVLVDKLIGLIGLLAIAVGGLFISHTQVPSEIPLSIGLFILFLLIGLFCLNFPICYRLITTLLTKATCRWSQFDHLVLRILRFLDAWVSYLSQPYRLIYVFSLGAAFQLNCVWFNTLLAQELGINVTFTDFCWIFGIVSMALLLPISVGGIGVRESAFVGALSLQGVPVEKAIALSLAGFSISLLTTATGGLLELFSKSHPRT